MKKILVCLALALVALTSLSAQVKPGIEVLRDRNFKELQGKRVGLLTNPSGVDRNLKSTIEIFMEAPEVNLVALFAPEHGVRGDIWAGGKVETGKDEATGLPVHSLYGATRQATPEMLKGLDVVVYDIQDVGTRSYTFISSLGLLMRTCADMGVEVLVLDRPNPLGGLKIEGPLVRDGFHSFVSQYKIPYIYGLTVGELANLINEERLNCGQRGDQPARRCKLGVIPMEGWTRDMTYEKTGLPWIMPSPNIPYPRTAICYPCSGLAGELYNYLNIGIGYTIPFDAFAAEWIDAHKLKEKLDSYKVPGVLWREIHYTPFYGSGAKKLLHGVQFNFSDYEAAPITMIQFYVMQAVYELYGKTPFQDSQDRWSMFDKVCGTDYVRLTFSKRYKVADIKSFWDADVENFRKLARCYYIY